MERPARTLGARLTPDILAPLRTPLPALRPYPTGAPLSFAFCGRARSDMDRRQSLTVPRHDKPDNRVVIMSVLRGCNGDENGAERLAPTPTRLSSRVSRPTTSALVHVATLAVDERRDMTTHDMTSAQWRDMNSTRAYLGAVSLDDMTGAPRRSTGRPGTPRARGAGSQIGTALKTEPGRSVLTRGQKISTKSFFMSHDMNCVAA